MAVTLSKDTERAVQHFQSKLAFEKDMGGMRLNMLRPLAQEGNSLALVLSVVSGRGRLIHDVRIVFSARSFP